MFEQPKVGIVYRNQPPQIISDRDAQRVSWVFEHFNEEDVCSGSPRTLKDYLAVFYSLEGGCSEIQRYLAEMFPCAELVGYRSSKGNTHGNLLDHESGLLCVQLPLPFYLARYLLEDFSRTRNRQKEIALVRRHADRVQEFFNTFAAAMESFSKATDRELGMSLLINNLLSNIQAEECALYRFGDGGKTLHRSYGNGNIRDFDILEHQANSAIIQNVLQSGKPYLNNHYTFEREVPFSNDGVSIRSILCFPLQSRGETIGVIELINNMSGAFTPEDQTFVELLSALLATAIQTQDWFEEAERLTITDDLTKLYNYRYLMQYLEAEVKHCLRYKKKVSLLFIDVDGFKRINDTFGHLVGSHALSEMGQVFRGVVRETDVVSRYGGDEFAIVLPETSLNGAMVIAERIRKKVEEFEFIAQNLSISLTVSLGVASCPEHALTAKELIKKADAAMYRAKELSKNSVKIAV